MIFLAMREDYGVSRGSACRGAGEPPSSMVRAEIVRWAAVRSISLASHGWTEYVLGHAMPRSVLGSVDCYPNTCRAFTDPSSNRKAIHDFVLQSRNRPREHACSGFASHRSDSGCLRSGECSRVPIVRLASVWPYQIAWSAGNHFGEPHCPRSDDQRRGR